MSNITKVPSHNKAKEIVEESGMIQKYAETVTAIFSPYFHRAEDSLNGIEIPVLNSLEECTPEMAKNAREMRLSIRKVRTEADKVRKELKAEALKYNRGVDNCFKAIKDMIEPMEVELKEIEDAPSILEEQRKQTIREEREKVLSEFIRYIPVPPGDLADYSQSDFDALIEIGRDNKQIREKEDIRASRTNMIDKSDLWEYIPAVKDFAEISEQEFAALVDKGVAKKKETEAIAKAKAEEEITEVPFENEQPVEKAEQPETRASETTDMPSSAIVAISYIEDALYHIATRNNRDTNEARVKTINILEDTIKELKALIAE